MKTYAVTPHYNRLEETDLLKGHKIFNCRNIENYSLIIPVTPLPNYKSKLFPIKVNPNLEVLFDKAK